MFAGLIGAIVWNLATWWFGLPSSSSHALIGGVVGAALVAAGTGAVEIDRDRLQGHHPGADLAGARRAAWPRSASRHLPLIRAFSAGTAEARVPLGQVASSSMVALAHGTNDAQKTMGVISLALDRQRLDQAAPRLDVPIWVVVVCATAIAPGHLLGRLADHPDAGHQSRRGAAAAGLRLEAIAAAVILASSHVGFPLSTTHVVSGAVMRLGRRAPAARGQLERGRATSSSAGC